MREGAEGISSSYLIGFFDLGCPPDLEDAAGFEVEDLRRLTTSLRMAKRLFKTFGESSIAISPEMSASGYELNGINVEIDLKIPSIRPQVLSVISVSSPNILQDAET